MKIIKLKFKHDIDAMDKYYILKDGILQGYELSGPIENSKISKIFEYLRKSNLVDTTYTLERYLLSRGAWKVQEIYELQGNDIADWEEQLIHLRIAE